MCYGKSLLYTEGRLGSVSEMAGDIGITGLKANEPISANHLPVTPHTPTNCESKCVVSSTSHLNHLFPGKRFDLARRRDVLLGWVNAQLAVSILTPRKDLMEMVKEVRRKLLLLNKKDIDFSKLCRKQP